MWLISKLISYLGKIPFLNKTLTLLTEPASKTFKSSLAIILMLCYIVYSSYTYMIEVNKNQHLLDQNSIYSARILETKKEIVALRSDIKELQTKADLLLAKQQEIRQSYSETILKANDLLKQNTCSNVALSNELLKLMHSFDPANTKTK